MKAYYLHKNIDEATVESLAAFLETATKGSKIYMTCNGGDRSSSQVVMDLLESYKTKVTKTTQKSTVTTPENSHMLLKDGA